MLRLMLLRHAKTERDSPTGLDRDRRLDSRGRKNAPDIANWMATHGLIPDFALVSTAVRAHETWQLVADKMPRKLHAEPVADLYGADPSQLLQIARSAGTRGQALPHSVLIVAHNPGLHEFALALVATGEPAGREALAHNLPTSGLAVIDFDAADWTGIGVRTGRLERFITPALLRPKA